MECDKSSFECMNVQKKTKYKEKEEETAAAEAAEA